MTEKVYTTSTYKTLLDENVSRKMNAMSIFTIKITVQIDELSSYTLQEQERSLNQDVRNVKKLKQTKFLTGKIFLRSKYAFMAKLSYFISSLDFW